MALTERLALLVSLDAKGAVNGLERIGKTADRELGKTQKGLDRTGKQLQKAGIGMAAFGALAIGGLGKAAMASEDAQLQVIKLQNSLKNNPKLAGESAKSFLDLAEAIQDKTAADGDAVVAGQAMLATFRVTGDQIRTLTPLVVDYARKFGVDLVTANASVGKALDGNVGALKRNGVSIDEVLFKTDRYAAVQKALAEQVGGFAEAEGKTFAGSLQRMKNELGDLAEGVGVGAVDAFTTLLGPVSSLADKITGLDSGLLATSGKVATFGAAGLTAAGGLSFLVGKAIELRKSITDLPSRLKTLTSGLGGLKIPGAVAAGAVGLFALAMFKATEKANRLRDAARQLADEAEATGQTLEDVALRKLATTFGESDQVAAAMDRLGVSFEDLREPLQGSKSDFDEWADSITATDVAATGTANSASVLRGRVKVLREELAEAEQITSRTAEATSALGLETNDLKEGTEDATNAFKELNDELSGMFNPLFKAQDALMDLADAQEAVTEAEREHGVASTEAQAARREAIRSTLDYESAMLDLKAGIEDGTVSVEDATATLNAWAAQGFISKRAADEAAYAFAVLAGRADGLNGKNVVVRAYADVGAAMAALDALIGKLGVVHANSVANLNQGPLYGIRQAEGGPVPHLAGGGFPGGPVGTDTVPAWLTPGEYVINARAAARLGAGTLNALNSGMAGGGVYLPSQVTLVIDGHSVLARVVADAQASNRRRGMA